MYLMIVLIVLIILLSLLIVLEKMRQKRYNVRLMKKKANLRVMN
jgi:hypothetical protein